MTIDEKIKKFAREMVTWSGVTRVGPTADQMEPFDDYVERSIREINAMTIEAEREAYAMIVGDVKNREREMWAKYKEPSQPSHIIAEEIENKIRARSEGEKKGE